MTPQHQPMRERKAVKEAFTDLAPRYEKTVDGELHTFWGWSYKGFVDQLTEQTPLKANDKVLDIATGTAVIPRTFLIRGIEGHQFTGLDITEAMLREGQREIDALGTRLPISLTCGDAMALPFASDSYDVVVSGLATHHMDIGKMLSESLRVMKKDGVFSIVDVGISPFWQSGLMRGVSRLIAFVYFLFKENATRAWAEASAVTNVWTPGDWSRELERIGFREVSIQKIPSQRTWSPDPLAIRAKK